MLAGVGAALVTPQPLAVQQAGARLFERTAIALVGGDRLPVERLSIGVARGQRGAPGGDCGGPRLAGGGGPGGELGQGPGREIGLSGPDRRLDMIRVRVQQRDGVPGRAGRDCLHPVQR